MAVNVFWGVTQRIWHIVTNVSDGFTASIFRAQELDLYEECYRYREIENRDMFLENVSFIV
jgi:hypothetical protein